MHPAARKCVLWAAVFLIVGSTAVAYSASWVTWLTTDVLHDFSATAHVADVLVTLIRLTLNPLGAALIASAVVIQVLAPLGARRPSGGAKNQWQDDPSR